ncbi:protein TOPLESS-like isoform X1 [Gossypium australe]|uniref:Protein TOPLESS-like isoform X1 n=1 Tax=Gossypium australe TaxID=47621 RepID=A0A5B6WTL0_9ROSI|nr:protein TOPLESS-like isoform X1 [Gossypium australe]
MDVKTNGVLILVVKQVEGYIAELVLSSCYDFIDKCCFRLQIFTWNLGGWGKCKSKQLQFTDERIPVRGSNTMVQFHQDQVHFLVVHETQLSIYEAKELGCVQQWIPEDSTRISQATLSCDSQMTRGKIS